MDSSIASDFILVLAWRGAEIAALGAVAMLAGALLVRRHARYRERLRARLADAWRPVLTIAALDDGELPAVTPPKRRHMPFVMEEWNAFQDSLRGSGTARLNELACRIGIDVASRRMLHGHGLGAQILAIRTVGHLRDSGNWVALQEQLATPNALLSFYAAAALIQIDAQRAMPAIVAQLAEREEWPGEAIAGLLKEAGTQVTREPIRALILSLAPAKIPALLPWLRHADVILASEVGVQLLRAAHDSRTMAAALSVIQDREILPEMRPLASSPDAELRKQLALALGRLADTNDADLLVTLMCDSWWWVRYRAAHALVNLRGMSPALLESIRARLTDRYARDMLDHVRAESPS